MKGNAKDKLRLHGYKNLLVWQKASDLAKLIYEVTEKFPKTEFRLVGQMRGSSVSVIGNIAEGYCRGALGDYMRFLEIARGSLGELGSYIHYASRVNLLSQEDTTKLFSLYNQVAFLLDKLIVSLKKKSKDKDWDRNYWIKEEAEFSYYP